MSTSPTPSPLPAPRADTASALLGPQGRLWAWLAAALTLCVLVEHVCWIEASCVQYTFDLPLHAQAAFNQASRLDQGNLSEFLTMPDFNHGPLTHQAGIGFMRLFGLSVRNLVLSSVLWIPLYGLAMFTIGRVLFDRRTGVWATAYLFSIPAFVEFSKQYPPELVSHAAVLTALAALLVSDMLRRPGWSVAFGLCLTASLLTKAEVFAIWAGPMLFLTLRLFLAHVRTGGQRLMTLLALVAVGWIAGGWYATHQKSIFVWMHDERHFGAFVTIDGAALALVLALVFGRRRRSWGADEWADRFWNLVVVGCIVTAALVPFALGKDFLHLYEERLHNAGEGFFHGVAWFDPMYYARAFVGRTYGALYGLLLAVGCAVFVATRAWRDERRGFFGLMFLYVLGLVNVASGKYEVYLFNVFGFTAVLATFWIHRWPWVRVVAPTLLAVSAWLQIFGWLLLPPRIPSFAGRDPRDRVPFFTQFDDLEAPERATWAVRPVLPSSPVHVHYAFDRVLTRVAEAAGGPCDLVVGGTPACFEIFHHDTFILMAAYLRLPIHVIAGETPTTDPNAPSRPVFFALQGEYPAYGSEETAAFWYRKLMATDEAVRMELVGAWCFRAKYNLLIYRVHQPGK